MFLNRVTDRKLAYPVKKAPTTFSAASRRADTDRLAKCDPSRTSPFLTETIYFWASDLAGKVHEAHVVNWKGGGSYVSTYGFPRAVHRDGNWAQCLVGRRAADSRYVGWMADLCERFNALVCIARSFEAACLALTPS
jgi:hypothetical protein